MSLEIAESEWKEALKGYARQVERLEAENTRLREILEFDRFDLEHKPSYCLNALYEGEISLAKACEWLRNYANGVEDPIVEGVLLGGGWGEKSPKELVGEIQALQARVEELEGVRRDEELDSNE
jgi:hypothetical protein